MSIPPWMEKVAEAGGWEESAKIKAQKELADKMDKIPVEKWKNMLDTILSVEKIVDKGGLDLSLIAGWKDNIIDVFNTELNSALSPLKNDLMAGINTAIAPLMPAIQALSTQISGYLTTGVGFIEALITGKVDVYLRQIKLENQDAITQFRKDYSDWLWANEAFSGFKASYKKKYGIDLDVLGAQGTAGGVYSGQFDLSPEDIAKLINMDLKLPDFTED